MVRKDNRPLLVGSQGVATEVNYLKILVLLLEPLRNALLVAVAELELLVYGRLAAFSAATVFLISAALSASSRVSHPLAMLLST